MNTQPDITAFNGSFPFASGSVDFDRALRQIQRTYGGGSITETQLEALFHRWLRRTGNMPYGTGQGVVRMSDFVIYLPGGGVLHRRRLALTPSCAHSRY
jgi:hypothetical protein